MNIRDLTIMILCKCSYHEELKFLKWKSCC